MNNIDKNTLKKLVKNFERQVANTQRSIEDLRKQFNPKTVPKKEKSALMSDHALKVGDTKKCPSTYGTVLGFDDDAEIEAEKRRLRKLAKVRVAESWGGCTPGIFDDNVKLMMGCEKPQITDEFSPLCFLYMSDAESFLKEVGQDGIEKILSL